MSTDRHWNEFADEDPYHAVLTDPAYHRDMPPGARQRFFQGGEDHIAWTLATLRNFFAAPEQFGISLDFGCGVGRLLLPLAKRSRLAIGIDIAREMRAECRRNADAAGIRNVEIYASDDALSEVAGYRGKVDVVVSSIVFQHIPPPRGLAVLRALLELLRPGGWAVLHLLVAAAIEHLPAEISATTGAKYAFYQRIGEAALVRLDGIPDSTRIMQMNHYNLNELVCILQARGVTEFLVRTTNHDGAIGADLYLRKP